MTSPPKCWLPCAVNLCAGKSYKKIKKDTCLDD
jgi:hypothetical protein